MGMAMVLVAAQEHDVSSIIAEIGPRQRRIRCASSKAVESGAGKSQSAETILRAVGAACLPAELALRNLYAEPPIGSTHTEKLMQRDKKQGEDAGIAALLRVWAKTATNQPSR